MWEILWKTPKNSAVFMVSLRFYTNFPHFSIKFSYNYREISQSYQVSQEFLTGKHSKSH
jgi:hypothetical protein